MPVPSAPGGAAVSAAPTKQELHRPIGFRPPSVGGYGILPYPRSHPRTNF
ncbi:hypothetical protein [Leyella stercorea]|nr:hypothetical protein [Leyella stercorea]